MRAAIAITRCLPVALCGHMRTAHAAGSSAQVAASCSLSSSYQALRRPRSAGTRCSGLGRLPACLLAAVGIRRVERPSTFVITDEDGLLLGVISGYDLLALEATPGRVDDSIGFFPPVDRRASFDTACTMEYLLC